jgi:8-oxo-dGTP diphosphatase
MSGTIHEHDPPIEVVTAIIRHDGKVLLTRRREGTHLAGFWEFPGGKAHPGESMEAALIREVREEIGVRIKVGSLIDEETHTYTDRTVHLHFFNAHIVEGTPRPMGVADLVWAFPSQLDRYDLPPANARVVEQLR